MNLYNRVAESVKDTITVREIYEAEKELYELQRMINLYMDLKSCKIKEKVDIPKEVINSIVEKYNVDIDRNMKFFGKSFKDLIIVEQEYNDENFFKIVCLRNFLEKILYYKINNAIIEKFLLEMLKVEKNLDAPTF